MNKDNFKKKKHNFNSKDKKGKLHSNFKDKDKNKDFYSHKKKFSKSKEKYSSQEPDIKQDENLLVPVSSQPNININDFKNMNIENIQALLPPLPKIQPEPPSQSKIGKYFTGKNLINILNTNGDLYFLDSSNEILSLSNGKVLSLSSEDLSINKTFSQPSEEIISFTYSKTRKILICLMSISMVRIFDYEQCSCINKFKLNKLIGRIVKLDPSENYFAIVTSQNSILIYDNKTFNLEETFAGHDGIIYDIAFNPIQNKFMLYSGGEDNSARVWNILLKKCVGVLMPHTSSVRHLCSTNDGKFLITGTFDNKIFIWKLYDYFTEENTKATVYETNCCFESMIYFTRIVKNVQANVPSLLLGGENGNLFEFNLQKGKIVNQTDSFINQPLVQLYYNVQKKLIYGLTSDQNLIYLDIDLINSNLNNIKMNKIVPCFCQEILSVRFIKGFEKENGKDFLFASNDNILKYYDGNNDKVYMYEGHEDFIMSIIIKENYIVTTSKDNSIRIWKFEYVKNEDEDKYTFENKCICVLKGHSETVNYSDISLKKKKFIVSGCKDGSVKLWNIDGIFKSKNEEVINIKEKHKEEENKVDNKIKKSKLSKKEDNEEIEDNEDDEEINEENEDNEEEEDEEVNESNEQNNEENEEEENENEEKGENNLEENENEEEEESEQQFFNNNVSDTSNPSIYKIQKSSYSIISHEDEVNVVKFSPNEKLIASGSYDKLIKIYNLKLETISIIKGHKRGITDLSFSPYAKILVSSSTDKTIKIWNLNDNSCLNSFEGHLSSILKVDWIYNGTHIISTGADGLIKFWNLKNSECINTIDGHEGKIWAMDTAYEADTKQLKFVTGGTDGKITLWNDITEEKEKEMIIENENKINNEDKLRMMNFNGQYLDSLKLSLEMNHKYNFFVAFENFVNDTLNKKLKNKCDDKESKNNEDKFIDEIINNRKILDKEVKEIDYAGKYNEAIIDIINNEELIKLVKDNCDKIIEIIRDFNIKNGSFLFSQILLKLLMKNVKMDLFMENKVLFKGKEEEELESKDIDPGFVGIDNLKNKEFINKKRKRTMLPKDYIENLQVIKIYSDKHLERLNREITKSYMIDYSIEKLKLI